MTPAEIAKKLTPAQRDCFARGSDHGFIALGHPNRCAMINLGLAECTHRRSYTMKWTPLGLSVRAILDQEPAE